MNGGSVGMLKCDRSFDHQFLKRALMQTLRVTMGCGRKRRIETEGHVGAADKDGILKKRGIKVIHVNDGHIRSAV